MPRRLHLRRALVLGTLTCSLAAACGGGDDGERPEPDATASTVHRTTPASSTPDGTAATDSEVVRFDAPAEITCTTPEGSVRVSYVTRDVTTVAFAVDGASAGGAVPPISGEHDVSVPCDGRVHTILLVAVGPSGQAVATRAVATRPG
jgi:hypothetical protein